MSTKKEESPGPGKPESRIYDFPGAMARLWSAGWYCTCGGTPKAPCQHIEAARELHKAGELGH